MIGPRRSLRGLALVLLVATAAGAGAGEDATAILRRAEEVRNPDLDFAVDFTIESVSGGDKPYEWNASYSMVARGKERTVILMRSPAAFYGGLVLIDQGRYWMLLPRATKPMELSAAQVLRGDVSSGDLARTDLTRGYAVALAGEEPLDGEPCWRLELTRKDPSARYSRIAYWVAKKGSQPRRLDYYGNTGRVLRSIRLSDYRKGPLGVRSMSLEIGSYGEWEDRTALAFANLRRLPAETRPLDVDAMDPIRKAALAVRDEGKGSDVPIEEILAAASAAGAAASRP